MSTVIPASVTLTAAIPPGWAALVDDRLRRRLHLAREVLDVIGAHRGGDVFRWWLTGGNRHPAASTPLDAISADAGDITASIILASAYELGVMTERHRQCGDIFGLLRLIARSEDGSGRWLP